MFYGGQMSMYGGPKNDAGARGYLFKKVDEAGTVVLPEKKEQNIEKMWTFILKLKGKRTIMTNCV